MKCLKILQSSKGLSEYETYTFSRTEKVRYAATALGIMAALAVLFYRSLIAVIFLIPIGAVYLKMKKKDLLRKKKERLSAQFKDALLSVSAVLQAGYSVENAFAHAYKEMLGLYGDRSEIAKELAVILNNINLSIPIEQSLRELAEKTEIEDIETFATVFEIAKRRGGDLIKIIIKTTNEICDKADIKSEIATIISAKKYEQKILSVMPLFIIVYVGITSAGMLDILYHNAIGVLVMTACLGVYGLAILLARKITDIEV